MEEKVLACTIYFIWKFLWVKLKFNSDQNLLGEDIETAKGCDNTCSQEPNNIRISIERVTKPFKISVKLLRNTVTFWKIPLDISSKLVFYFCGVLNFKI